MLFIVFAIFLDPFNWRHQDVSFVKCQCLLQLLAPNYASQSRQLDVVSSAKYPTPAAAGGAQKWITAQTATCQLICSKLLCSAAQKLLCSAAQKFICSKEQKFIYSKEQKLIYCATQKLICSAAPNLYSTVHLLHCHPLLLYVLPYSHSYN